MQAVRRLSGTPPGPRPTSALHGPRLLPLCNPSRRSYRVRLRGRPLVGGCRRRLGRPFDGDSRRLRYAAALPFRLADCVHRHGRGAPGTLSDAGRRRHAATTDVFGRNNRRGMRVECGRIADLLRRQSQGVVHARNGRVHDIALGRNTPRARPGTHEIGVSRSGRRPGHRPKRDRSRALETVPRRHGGRSMDRPRGCGHVRAPPVAGRQSGLADVDRRAHLLLGRSRRDRQPLFLRARCKRRAPAHASQRLLRALSVDRREKHRLHCGRRAVPVRPRHQHLERNSGRRTLVVTASGAQVRRRIGSARRIRTLAGRHADSR